MEKVALVPCSSYDPSVCLDALRQALDAIGALDFVKPGMKIALKTNLVSAMKPEDAATVHPAVLEALAFLLKERGATVIIGDSPGGLFTVPHLQKVYSTCGLLPLEQDGITLNRDVRQCEVLYPDARRAKSFPFTAYLQEADAVIGVCKFKTHGMMGMTGAVKNFFGVIPGALKPEFHYRYPAAEDFADMLADLYEYVSPRFCLCDAVMGMEGNGPTRGTPRFVGCLLASASGHALDLVAADLMGLSSDQVPTLTAARKRGLIPAAVDETAVFGELSRFRQKNFRTVPSQSTVRFRKFGTGLTGKIVAKVLTPVPVLNASLCVGCGQCRDICPAGAITMAHQKPSIRRNRCIHCFCCQEFCPKGALKGQRSPLLALMGLLSPNNKGGNRHDTHSV